MQSTQIKQKRESIRQQVEALAANRQCPEARALYVTLAKSVHRRVQWRARAHYSDLVSRIDCEEVTADVLMQLMCGSLARFRGDTMGELIAFVRAISDRALWRFARRRLRERDALEGQAGECVRDWNAKLPNPEQALEWKPEPFLDEKDANYLKALLHAGSRADFARTAGVSRAAVTQRVQRIRARIDALPKAQRDATEKWFCNLSQQAAIPEPVTEARPDW